MRMVDLSPDDKGDRIGVVTEGTVSYIPARRFDIGWQHDRAGGFCRYIKRASDNALYVTGPSLGKSARGSADGMLRFDDGKNRMFSSRDDGRTWTSWELNIENLGFTGAFAILRDDTFLMAYMPDDSEYTHIYVARSRDAGRSWEVGKMAGDIRPYRSISMWNGDLFELSDGTVLLTCNLRHRNSMEDAISELPIEMWGAFAHVFRSEDGGNTWGERFPISSTLSAETHLLELPSGTLLGAVRRQRSHRLPGDPEDLLTSMRANGYDPEYRGNVEHIDEGPSGTALYKSVYLTESGDGGRTWVNERRVTDYEQCSGELTLLADGKTLVVQYDSRFNDRFAGAGVRARASYDTGKTWEPEEYILGEGENYPGSIAMPDNSLITVCPYRDGGPIQAVRWTIPGRPS